MKKTLCSAVMAGALAFTLGSLFITPAMANCPAKSPCAQKAQPAAGAEFKKPMSPDEHAKMREQKKAEFEERLKLTESQKVQLEKIKADEKKALEPYKEKIRKEQAKIDELFAKEREIRKNSIEKFESLLTAEQKAELEKIKAEVKEEMEKMAPPMGPCGPKFGPKGPMGPHHKPM